MTAEKNATACLKHPDRAAVAHCSVCRKPVCDECIVAENGFKCCSRECLTKAIHSNEVVSNVLTNKRKSDSKAAVRRYIRWAIVALFLILLFVFRAPIKSAWDRHVVPIFNQGSRKIDEINRENIEKDRQRRRQREKILEDAAEGR